MAFLEILCKHGNYLCKHGNYNPLYKKEIYYMSRIIYFSTFFPLVYIWKFSFSSVFFFILISKWLTFCRLYLFFPYILILECLKSCHNLFIFPYFPLYFTFKIFKILSFLCILYKHLFNFTSWHTLNIFFIKVGIPWRHRSC